MGEREGGDLPEHGLEADGQEEDAQDEEDVVEALGEDVGEAEEEVLLDDVPAAQWDDGAVERERFAGLEAFDPLRDGVGLAFIA